MIEALARRGLLPEVSPKPCASTLSFGLVLLEYFLLEKRCLLSIGLPLILSYLGKKLIGISPLAEPGLDRYDAMYLGTAARRGAAALSCAATAVNRMHTPCT